MNGKPGLTRRVGGIRKHGWLGSAIGTSPLAYMIYRIVLAVHSRFLRPLDIILGLNMFHPGRMLDNAWDWAEKHHKKRKNPVHGEEEICFVLDDEFLFRAENGQSMTMHGEFSLEEMSCMIIMHLYNIC